VIRSGQTLTTEEQVLINGRQAITLSQKVPLRNDKSDVVGVLGISFDITKQKNNEEELRKTKYMLENVLNTIPGHVYWKDEKCNYLGCNDAQANSLGLNSRQEIIGKNDFELSWKEQALKIREADLRVINHGESITVEEPALLKDGRLAIFLSKKVPLYNEQKNIVGVLGVSLDITELKKTQQELLETQHKLEGMTLVSAVIAHELRTPLSAFGVATEGLKSVFPKLKQAYLWAKEHSAPIDDLTSDYLIGIEQSIMSMGQEVRAAFTFIDMALLNSDPNVDKGNREIFPISASVEDALARYPFHGNRELVHWQNNPQTDFQIKADKILITHVLFNLLKNALYYVAAAGKGDIQIWLEKGTDYNKLYFKDTGTGIDSEVLPHIFERFFSRTYHGAGIGLTFCKTVMESIGGNISCESVKGDYTLFALNFPVTFS
jgi:PAS domain S-box-containing protein